MLSPVPPTKVQEHRSQLSGYGEATTTAVARVAEYDGTARWRRSVRGLLQCWGIAVLSVFIPVAHFFLVPGFFVAGVVVFFRRRTADRVVMSVSGRCPDCGLEQSFDAPSRWQPPLALDCKQCHRRLRMSAPPSAA